MHHRRVGSLQVDYTIHPNRRYRWDLWSDASHPTALIALEAQRHLFSGRHQQWGWNDDAVHTRSPRLRVDRDRRAGAHRHHLVERATSRHIARPSCSRRSLRGLNSVCGDLKVNLKVDVNAPASGHRLDRDPRAGGVVVAADRRVRDPRRGTRARSRAAPAEQPEATSSATSTPRAKASASGASFATSRRASCPEVR